MKTSTSRAGRKNLNQREISYVVKHYKTTPIKRIAAKLKRSTHAIYKVGARLGLERDLHAKSPYHYWNGKRKFIVKPDGCWSWIASKDPHGYGIAHGSDALLAHRQMYIDTKGPIPDGLVLDHLCRNPSCINPSHLEPVPQRVNVWRGSLAKISIEDVRAIRADAASSSASLARKFSISPTNVKAIRSGKTWQDETFSEM